MRSAVVTSAALCAALAGLATTAVDDSPAALRPASAPAGPPPVAAPAASEVTTEAQLREAWADPRRTRIDLGADIFLRDCFTGDPIRESPYPMTLDGHGHTIRQTCFEKRLLRQDGTGYLHLQGRRASPEADPTGPGRRSPPAARSSSRTASIEHNLSEEPGGGIFSMRRATIRDSRISGNLANDDGGGVYARRGGVQVYDSVLSNNLVDGSGGAVGSTGDILVVRSYDRRQHHRRRRWRALRRRGRRRDRHRLVHRRQRRGRSRRGYLHPRRRRGRPGLDAAGQPRRRPRWRHLRRGRRARRQLDARAEPRRRPRRRRRSGRAAT